MKTQGSFTVGYSQEDLFGGQYSINQPYDEWVGMPEYICVEQPEAQITAKFKFRNQEDYEKFHFLVKKHIYKGEQVFDGNQKIDKKQAWYPRLEKRHHLHYESSQNIVKKNPQFPVYVVSKGRFNNNPTSRSLQKMGVPFKIIVEEHEYDDYCNVVPKKNVLILPERYINEYDRFWDDNDERYGPGAARNYAWDHSIESGYDWHWVMDDNIDCFKRFNDNKKIRCSDGALFRCSEDFVLRYENIAISGLNYTKFCHWYREVPPFVLNTRIYSCLLIRNDIPYRWRGRYNEDTDLSLRALKDGWCTVQFNAFLQAKKTTQKDKGGNNDEFYEKEGTLPKSQMLQDMHPDVARVTWRFNRWHHYVDYSPFRTNKLLRKEGFDVKEGVDNYGMSIQKVV